MILGAGDDARLVVGRQAHGLRPVELRILKGGQADQAIAQRRRQILLGDVDLVAEHQFQLSGRAPAMGGSFRRRDGGAVHGASSSSSSNASRTPTTRPRRSASRAKRLGLCARDLPDGGQERPLVGVGLELLVQKDAVAGRSWLLLQRQGDQVAEAALGQRVLIREEPVIGAQPDLRAAFHRLGEKMRTQLPRQAGRDGLREEEPDVGAVAGARAFQSGGDVKPPTRLRNAPASSCQLSPSKSTARR